MQKTDLLIQERQLAVLWNVSWVKPNWPTAEHQQPLNTSTRLQLSGNKKFIPLCLFVYFGVFPHVRNEYELA